MPTPAIIGPIAHAARASHARGHPIESAEALGNAAGQVHARETPPAKTTAVPKRRTNEPPSNGAGAWDGAGGGGALDRGGALDVDPLTPPGRGGKVEGGMRVVAAM